jgi:uncharacterized protein (DUF488 family)
MREAFTIGHSSLPLAAFLALLRDGGIQQLADVRRFPGSRKHPHFAGPALARSLEAAGIAYRHFPALGGFRRARPDSLHRAWRVAGFRGYADHMGTPEFAAALSELERWAEQAPSAVMCAEAHFRSCHRQLLSDALLRDGFVVTHLLAPGRRETHRLPPFARLDRGRIVYDGDADEPELPGLE